MFKRNRNKKTRKDKVTKIFNLIKKPLEREKNLFFCICLYSLFSYD